MKIKFLVIKVFMDESELFKFKFLIMMDFLYIGNCSIVILLVLFDRRRRLKLFLDLLEVLSLNELELFCDKMMGR